MFSLHHLLKYERIVIQCHDNPDADTIASGFALLTYLESQGCSVILLYGGHLKISKPNLLLLIEELHIPLLYQPHYSAPIDLLITVDCQPSSGNISHFEADTICVIDHHIQVSQAPFLGTICPFLGSCSTLIWDLLRNVSFDLEQYPAVSTALYYGLLMDTNFLSEIRHPLDRDMEDALICDADLIRKLKFSNLSISDLELAGIALIRSTINTDDQFAVFKAHPCDPNILGFISDLAIQVNSILACIVYFETPTSIRFSVRSCTKEIMANELAAYLASDVGSGGGHFDKAGGFIDPVALNKKLDTGTTETYFHNITNNYFNSFDIIYEKDGLIDFSDKLRYQKRDLVLGYIPSLKLAQEGTPLLLRNLEGDSEIVCSPNTYLIVEVDGHTHAISKQDFEQIYQATYLPFDIVFDYYPKLRNQLTHEVIAISPLMNACKMKSSLVIYARALKKNLKLFTLAHKDHYLTGLSGDYLILERNNTPQLSIVPKKMFEATYVRI